MQAMLRTWWPQLSLVNWLPQSWQCYFGRHTEVVVGNSLSILGGKMRHWLHVKCPHCKQLWDKESLLHQTPEQIQRRYPRLFKN